MLENSKKIRVSIDNSRLLDQFLNGARIAGAEVSGDPADGLRMRLEYPNGKSATLKAHVKAPEDGRMQIYIEIPSD